jgi:hypothetical protein
MISVGLDNWKFETRLAEWFNTDIPLLICLNKTIELWMRMAVMIERRVSDRWQMRDWWNLHRSPYHDSCAALCTWGATLDSVSVILLCKETKPNSKANEKKGSIFSLVVVGFLF